MSEPHFRCDGHPPTPTLDSRWSRARRAGLPYLEPVVEAELIESAELVRADLTRSLQWVLVSACLFFWKGLATCLGLHRDPGNATWKVALYVELDHLL